MWKQLPFWRSNEDDYYIFNFYAFDDNSFVERAPMHKLDRMTRRKYDWKEIKLKYNELYKSLMK